MSDGQTPSVVAISDATQIEEIVGLLSSNLQLGSDAVTEDNVVEAVRSLLAAFGQLQAQNQQLRATLKSVL